MGGSTAVKPPYRIQVGPHTYRIVADKNEINRLSVEADETRLGECDPKTLTIFVDPTQADTMLRDTVLHELLHALMDLIGAGDDIARDLEERLVRRLAPVLLELLTRNPKLIEWLTQ